jgi:hypothetical protein
MNSCHLRTVAGSLAIGGCLLVSTCPGFAQSTLLVTTFTNPAPDDIRLFGYSVAAVGNDRVVVGAPNYFPGTGRAGTAYLFNSSGDLITTYTNPVPVADDAFGFSVAAVGSERVIIGAYGAAIDGPKAGAAFLFNTSGTLLTIFTNPAPGVSGYLGAAVAAVGHDKVIVSAPGDDINGPHVGVAYLFQTNGALLTTFTNPTPAAADGFGTSVATFGSDRVLIGAGYDVNATAIGAAYLFSTNATLLTAFTNPTPSPGDRFGYPLVAVGDDRVLVGANADDAGAAEAGAAYLFNTNGALLTVFTNPAPAPRGGFGFAVAALGNDQVVIGAVRSTDDVPGPGDTYIFNTQGVLLSGATNSDGAPAETVGKSVAVLTPEQLVVGSPGMDGGAAFLYRIMSPSLSIGFSHPSAATISWPAPSSGWVLQENSDLFGAGSWSNCTNNISDNGAFKQVIVTPIGRRFYRLLRE